MITEMEEKDFASSVAIALYGMSAIAVFHPERPRKHRCCIMRSEVSSGGVHDMVQIASGETWKKAAVNAVLGYRVVVEHRLRARER